VHPSFSNPTLIDARAVDLLKPGLAPPAAPDRLFLVGRAAPLDADASRQSTQKNKMVDAVRNFLLKTRLVKLETEQKEAINYFQDIATLSSVDGNADIEVALEEIYQLSITQRIPITTLCEMVEADLVSEESDSGHGILTCISEYSLQNLYLTKLKDVVDSVSASGLNTREFNVIDKFVQDAIADPAFAAPAGPQILSEPGLLLDFYKKCTEKIGALIGVQKIPAGTFRNLYSIVLGEFHVVRLFTEKRQDLQAKDRQIHELIETRRDDYLANHNPAYRKIFEQDRQKLKLFFDEFGAAFAAQQPLERIQRIHSGFQVLIGLLELNGEKEIGADQIVPFAFIGTVNCNPMGLATTEVLVNDFIRPLFSEGTSPLEHSVEYSAIQFLATCQLIGEKTTELAQDASG
jgi:hypothetical protein